MQQCVVPRATAHANDWALTVWWQSTNYRNQRQETRRDNYFPIPVKLSEGSQVTAQKLDYWISFFVLEIRRQDGQCYTPVCLTLLMVFNDIYAFFLFLWYCIFKQVFTVLEIAKGVLFCLQALILLKMTKSSKYACRLQFESTGRKLNVLCLHKLLYFDCFVIFVKSFSY